jgi:diguanylate cyclase (GGDEF)-like protein
MKQHILNESAKKTQTSCTPVHREIYAYALNKSLETFVSYTERSFDDVMSNGLSQIANVTDVDRILVFRVWSKEQSGAGEIYRWDRIEGGTRPVDDALKVLPVFPALKRWISAMSEDTCVSLRRSEFLPDEDAFLSPRGVQSILIVPVFTEGDLWGVITFHDNKNERDFDEDCVVLLRSAARLCVSTIIRYQKTKSLEQTIEALKRREMMTDTLNMASIIFLSQNEEKFADMMNSGIHLIADTANIDRLILYRNHITNEKLYMSQVYRWDKAMGGSTELLEAYSDVSYERFLPNWEEYLANGKYVNSPSKLLPGTEAGVLQAYSIASVAVIPVFIANSFWGFAIFGDTHNERYFEEDVIEMMRSSAFLFANAFIRAKMDYDALTGIYNRQFLDENLKRLINYLSRAGGLLSLMMIDIDFFKLYNDTYGHLEGDKCLKMIAQTLSQSIKRADDFVARYGGEEFIVILPNTDERGARFVADKMLDDIRNCNMPHKQSEAASCVTISIGVTTGKILHTHKADDLVKKADELLYKSKKEGRNRYSFEKFL